MPALAAGTSLLDRNLIMEADLTTQPGRGDVDPAVETAAPAAPSSPAPVAKTTPGQIVLVVLGAIAFLFFARVVVLPVFVACVAGMALKPLIRWLSCCHLPPALSAVVVLLLR